MTEQQALGIRLKSLLDEFGLTQIAMSELVGVHQGYFNQIIKGHKRISATVIFSIAKRYKNVNLRWLLTGEGSMYGLETIYEQPPPELPAGDQPADVMTQAGHTNPGTTMIYYQPDRVLQPFKDLKNNILEE